MERSKKRSWIEKIERVFDNGNRRQVALYKASPIGYPMIWLGVLVFWMLIFGSSLWYSYQTIKPIPIEGEISCNTGFIGVHVEGMMDNQPYTNNMEIYETNKVFLQSWSDTKNVTITQYHREPLLKTFGIKNINGLNCRMAFKGQVSPKQVFLWS